MFDDCKRSKHSDSAALCAIAPANLPWRELLFATEIISHVKYAPFGT
jgi:hypothetical protein